MTIGSMIRREKISADVRIRPYQVIPEKGVASEKGRGKIIVIVPTVYMNGSLRLSLEYAINDNPRYSNHVGLVEVTPYYQKQGETSDSISIVPNKDIRGNLNIALEYFEFVREYLEENKTDPPSFYEFLEM